MNSVEDEQRHLSWSYCTGVDTRFQCVQLAPLRTEVDLSSSQAGATNARKIVFSEGISSDTAELAVIANGTKLSTIRLDTRVMATNGSASAFSSAVTDLITTKAANGTQEISAALASNIYQVITAFATGSYTASANNESIINRIWMQGPSFEADGQVFGFGQASSVENIVRHNVLTGTVTMDASAWAPRATMGGSNLTFTGGALDGSIVIIGTTDGPYRFNNEHFVFIPMLPSLTQSASNCKNMAYWEKLGTVIPLERETRVSVGLDGYSIGPERFSSNTSPVQGRVTAQAYSDQWGWWAIYNAFADRTYLCAVRPRQRHEIHREPVSIYPIMELAAGIECESMAFAGTKAGVTSPTWYYGNDGNVGWFIEGRNQQHNQDTACTYAASGSLYTTAVKRDPDKDKTIKALKLRTSTCTATETITITQHWTDKFGVAQSVALAAINSNGLHIINVPQEKQIKTDSFYLEVALARGGTTTATPRIEPMGDTDILVAYEEFEMTNQNGMTLAQVAR